MSIEEYVEYHRNAYNYKIKFAHIGIIIVDNGDVDIITTNKIFQEILKKDKKKA